MNFAGLSVILIIVGSGAFGSVGPEFIVKNISALLAVVSIMAAAILVRLNRGVPSVDWKSVNAQYLNNLLDGIEKITAAYVVTFILALVCISTLFGVSLVFESSLTYKTLIAATACYIFGGLVGLLMSRMVYIIWLDLDIVRLQRVVIVSAADTLEGQLQQKIAEEKVEAMRQTRIVEL